MFFSLTGLKLEGKESVILLQKLLLFIYIGFTAVNWRHFVFGWWGGWNTMLRKHGITTNRFKNRNKAGTLY